MNARRGVLDVVDHVLHLLWQVFAVVGLFTLIGVAGGVQGAARLQWAILLGLAFGIVTSPAVVRRIRPRLQRRFPWAFDGGLAQRQEQ